ncbi:MAG TPA: outer membrane beta-barrel protein [Hanamia sp.]|nr:outer membrane beta-barrel protein [Hanamia sp.]
MDKNLHDMDDIFNRAYKDFEDEPSDDSWNNLQADLDRRDAEKYRRKFIVWKSAAILLLIVLSGIIVYKSFNKSIPRNGKTKNLTFEKKDTGNIQNTTIVNLEKNNDNYSDSLKTDLTKNSNNSSGKAKPEQEKNNKDNIIAIIPFGKPQKENSIITQKLKTPLIVKKEKNQNLNFEKATLIAESKHPSYNEQNNNITTEKIKNPKDHHLISLAGNEELNKAEFPDFQNYKPTPEVKIESNDLFNLNIPLQNKPIVFNKDSPIKKWIAGVNKNVFSQKFHPYWSVTGYGNNEWANYNLVNNEAGNVGSSSQEISEDERHEGSYSFGFYVTRQFSRKWGLKSGIFFAYTEIGISPHNIFASKTPDGTVAYQYNTSSGYGFIKPDFGQPPALGDSVLCTEAEQNLQSLNVPIMATYTFSKNKFAITPGAGLSFSYVTKVSIKTEVTDMLNYETEQINGLNGLKNFHTSFIADINLQYNFNKRWSINLLPQFRCAITQITKDHVVKTFPYRYGIGAALTYKF